MSAFSKIRIAIALALTIAAGSRAHADTVYGGSGSFSSFWANAGGANFQNNFSYNLFNTSLGTLQSVEFCLSLQGRGQWMADYGGDGTYRTLDITLTGGQAINVDGGNGWLGTNWAPVINDYAISSTVNLNDVQTPFWIMSPQDGPSFAWADSTSFNLPNISAFIGTGTNSATFSSYALLDYLTNPNVSLALEGHDYQWTANWAVKYNYAPVPEPGSALLLGSACAGLMLRRRRAKKA